LLSVNSAGLGKLNPHLEAYYTVYSKLFTLISDLRRMREQENNAGWTYPGAVITSIEIACDKHVGLDSRAVFSPLAAVSQTAGLQRSRSK
jgi:hypothetical protein